jgi:hypothetical protein
LPILGRHGSGIIIVNDLAKAYAGRRMKAKLIKRSQACVAEALDRECLVYEIGQPESL